MTPLVTKDGYVQVAATQPGKFSCISGDVTADSQTPTLLPNALHRVPEDLGILGSHSNQEGTKSSIQVRTIK